MITEVKVNGRNEGRKAKERFSLLISSMLFLGFVLHFDTTNAQGRCEEISFEKHHDFLDFKSFRSLDTFKYMNSEEQLSWEQLLVSSFEVFISKPTNSVSEISVKRRGDIVSKSIKQFSVNFTEIQKREIVFTSISLLNEAKRKYAASKLGMKSARTNEKQREEKRERNLMESDWKHREIDVAIDFERLEGGLEFFTVKDGVFNYKGKTHNLIDRSSDGSKIHNSTVYGVVRLPDGKFVSLGSRYMIIWKLVGDNLEYFQIMGEAGGRNIDPTKGHINDVRGMISYKDGKLISWGSEANILVWKELDSKWVVEAVLGDVRGSVLNNIKIGHTGTIIKAGYKDKKIYSYAEKTDDSQTIEWFKEDISL